MRVFVGEEGEEVDILGIVGGRAGWVCVGFGGGCTGL